MVLQIKLCFQKYQPNVIIYHKPNTNKAAAVQTPWYMLVQGSPTIHNTLCVTVRDPQSVKGLNVWQHLYWDRFIFMRRQFVTGIQWHEIIRRLKIYALVKRWVSLDIQVQIIWRIKMQLSDWYVEFVLKKVVWNRGVAFLLCNVVCVVFICYCFDDSLLIWISSLIR